MKTLGLIGGMSWESTVSYYQFINRGVNHQLGGLHSAKLCLYSVDFADIARYQHDGNWKGAADILISAAKSLEAMGAEGIVICTNTMHKVANIVQNAITIPLLHIADATGEKLKTDDVKHVGLLGTAFTMSERFYSSHLTDKFDLNVLTPTTDEQTTVHEIIYNELCKGVVCEASRNCYIEIINNLKQRGAEAIILGCTEIALLISQTDTPLPLYDTTQIHADAAVAFAIT